jgi:cysteine-rich repeat protein
MVNFPKCRAGLALLTLIACAWSLPAIAETRPPAGQMCPAGNYVIGFDPAGNIVCSGTCGNGALDRGEDCDDGNIMSDDGCSATCLKEGSMAGAEKPAAAAVASTAVAPASDASQMKPAGSAAAPAVSDAEPVITDVSPWSVVYRKRQLDVTISGSGFSSASVVIFEGQTYTPSVNPAGTELRVTLSTVDLAIGRYAIRVSNGPGKETLMKKAITVY